MSFVRFDRLECTIPSRPSTLYSSLLPFNKSVIGRKRDHTIFNYFHLGRHIALSHLSHDEGNGLSVVALGMWKLLYIVMVYVHHVTSDSVVRVSGGLLSGVQLPTSQGHVMSFLGVPYAKAPLGTLRFRKPDVTVKWDGIQNSTIFGPSCMQNMRNDGLQMLTMSENCLFLNIYVPGDIRSSNSDQLPVVVIVHPGNFQEGSGAMIDGKSIAISNHVIAVTFNFRLGVFGFLSLDGHYPGNVGLLDQVAVLEWVKQNIERFNGNPKNVVLVCDYFTSQKHISSTFNGLYDKIVTYSGDFEFGNLKKTNTFFEDIRQRCVSISRSIQKCLLQLNSSSLLNSSNISTRRRIRPMFWPVSDRNFPARAHRTSLGRFVPPLNTVDVVLTDLPFLDQGTSHHDDCDSTDFDDTSQNVIELLAGDANERTKQLMVKTLTTFYYSNQQDCGFRMVADFLWSSVLSFANSYYTQGLTLLTSAGLSAANDKNVTTTLMCVLTNCSTDVQSVNHALSQFLKYGYPTFADDAIVWRPYTPISKNYLSINDGSLATGDASSWPFRQQELLWFDLLPSLDVKVISEKSDGSNQDIPHNECITSYAEEQWGLSPSQLEALLFSLILGTLFLLVIVTALFRILCHFRGRKFFKAQGRGTHKKPAEHSSNQMETRSHVVIPNHTGLQNNTRSRNHVEHDTGTHCSHNINSTTPL